MGCWKRLSSRIAMEGRNTVGVKRLGVTVYGIVVQDTKYLCHYWLQFLRDSRSHVDELTDAPRVTSLCRCIQQLITADYYLATSVETGSGEPHCPGAHSRRAAMAAGNSRQLSSEAFTVAGTNESGAWLRMRYISGTRPCGCRSA